MAIQVVELLKEIFFSNRDRHGVPPLDGAFQPNEVLEHLRIVRSDLEAPDDFAINADGTVCVSSRNHVYRLSGEDFTKKTIVAEFDGQAGGLNVLSGGQLMVCIGNKGLAIVEKNGRKTWIKEAGGKAIKCPNSAVADSDGNIYLVDGSLHHKPSDWVRDLMEKRSNGRLIRYDRKGEKCDVLLEDMGYPNGLCISHDGKWLIVTESWNHTLSRYPLDDIRTGTQKTLIPNMPGYPGRIVPAADGGYWMCLFGMRTELVELVLTESDFRKEMMATSEPAHWIAPSLCYDRDPYEYCQIGAVRALGYLKPWAPPRSYGLVVKLNNDFEITKSFHSRSNGLRHGITGLCDHENRLFISSKGHGIIMIMEDHQA